MATLGTNVMTLTDWAKMRKPGGGIANIIELLNQTNRILDDMLFVEGNLPTGHRITQRTGLPGVFFRSINQGIPPTKSTEAQVDEATAMMNALSRADKALAELDGSVADFRMKKALAHLEAMAQEGAATIIYGNGTLDPEEFTGFAVRYSDLAAGNADNIIDAGGTGSVNTSVWLVGWGVNSVHGIFPKGSQMGIQHTDMGLKTVTVTAGVAGEQLLAYEDWYEWHLGIALEDWRTVARIANIDTTLLIARATPADLTIAMIDAMHRIPNLNAVKPVFYMNRTAYKELDIQGLGDIRTAGPLTMETIDGRERKAFRGIPVEKVDAILNNEARVV